MIREVKGNLLEAGVDALVNTVNCVGVMGKGIALQFKQAFPENFRAYRRACQNGKVRLGEVFVYESEELVNPKYIINFPTKQHWRGKSNYRDIERGMGALAETIKNLGIKSIAIPPLGTGHGGLKWSQVETVIRKALDDVSEVEIYLYVPGGTPKPDKIKVGTKRPSMTRGRALVIKLLNQYREQGYRHSLLEIQKLAYFLQEAGESLRLKFVKHKYGPYADALNHVLQHIDGHYVRGYGDRRPDAEIYLLPGSVPAADEFLKGNNEAFFRLERVRSLIEGFETPYGMELLSSVHWVSREDSDAARNPDHALRAVKSWNSRKARVFKSPHIVIAWQRLHSKGWLAQ